MPDHDVCNVKRIKIAESTAYENVPPGVALGATTDTAGNSSLAAQQMYQIDVHAVDDDELEGKERQEILKKFRFNYRNYIRGFDLIVNGVVGLRKFTLDLGNHPDATHSTVKSFLNTIFPGAPRPLTLHDIKAARHNISYMQWWHAPHIQRWAKTIFFDFYSLWSMLGRNEPTEDDVACLASDLREVEYKLSYFKNDYRRDRIRGITNTKKLRDGTTLGVFEPRFGEHTRSDFDSFESIEAKMRKAFLDYYPK